jgi:hypothetical protein
LELEEDGKGTDALEPEATTVAGETPPSAAGAKAE